MLENRDYMRQPEYQGSGWRPPFRLRWSWTVALLVVYTLVFLVGMVAERYYPGNLVFNSRRFFYADGVAITPGYLPLSLEGLRLGYFWQLITYQFMHAGWLHLILNGWVIYMFGRELEHLLGGKKYLALVLSSGVVGGVVQMLVAFVWPQYFGTHLQDGHIIGGAVVGASAAGFGLIAAYAALFPQIEFQLLLLFVIPVSLRARTFLIGSIAVALAGFGFPNAIMPGVAHAAHLGGMAMGWFFVRNILQGDWRKLGGALRPAEKTVSPRLNQAGAEDDEKIINEDEVNAVLDKISAQGIQSLTKREREILETARKRMGQR